MVFFSLYGITCLQTYIFFYKNQRDSWIFKLLVNKIPFLYRPATDNASLRFIPYGGYRGQEDVWTLITPY